MAKNYVTLTVEFECDAPRPDVVRNLISRIGNLDNDELGYTITKVFNSSICVEEAYDEDEEDWND